MHPELRLVWRYLREVYAHGKVIPTGLIVTAGAMIWDALTVGSPVPRPVYIVLLAVMLIAAPYRAWRKLWTRPAESLFPPLPRGVLGIGMDGWWINEDGRVLRADRYYFRITKAAKGLSFSLQEPLAYFRPKVEERNQEVPGGWHVELLSGNVVAQIVFENPQTMRDAVIMAEFGSRNPPIIDAVNLLE